MKARPSLVLGSNQAVLYEPWPNVIFHELASRNWPLAFQLETWEHPIRRPSVGRFPVPFAQELCDARDHRHGLAALFALALSHIAVEPSAIQSDDSGVPVNVAPLQAKKLTDAHACRGGKEDQSPAHDGEVHRNLPRNFWRNYYHFALT